MKGNIKILFIGAWLILFFGCEMKAPTNLWKNRPQGDPPPVIERIEPEGGADPGVLEIKIIGQNFDPIPERNFVYFGPALVQYISVSPETIRVYRPSISEDSLSVTVVVQGAVEFARKSYRVDPVYASLGVFEASERIYTVEADKEGNVYVYLNTQVVKKLTPDGASETVGTTSSPFGIATDMRFSPDGYLYMQQRNNKSLHRMPPGGGEFELKYKQWPSAVNYIDFDENGNLYAAGKKTSVYVLRPDGSIETVADYKNFEVLAVRVHEGYVYFLALAQTPGVASGVYRNAIQSGTGTLGDSELVLDWSTTGEWASSKFTDIAFSTQGDMYISTDHTDPILVVKRDGTQVPLYKGIIKSQALELARSGNHLIQRWYQASPEEKFALYVIRLGEGGTVQ